MFYFILFYVFYLIFYFILFLFYLGGQVKKKSLTIAEEMDVISAWAILILKLYTSVQIPAQRCTERPLKHWTLKISQIFADAALFLFFLFFSNRLTHRDFEKTKHPLVSWECETAGNIVGLYLLGTQQETAFPLRLQPVADDGWKETIFKLAVPPTAWSLFLPETGNAANTRSIKHWISEK